MNVPLLDLRAQLRTIEDELKHAVLEVIDSVRYIGGPKIDELERRIAEYTGTSHAVGVSSGTDALLVSLMALDIGPGDFVITTPYSFFATAGVIARLGGRPVFVDIDPESYTMGPACLRAWFEENRGEADRVKAIIPVHLYGQCADMDPIMAVARESGAAVVEDAAQAIGALYPASGGDVKAGGIGIAGCLSFFPSKNLGGIGDGGMVVSSDEAFAVKVGLLRNHGAHPKYYHSMIGGNFRLDAIQAAALLVKLGHLDTWHAMRRENARYYDENLSVPGLRTPKAVFGRDRHIYNQYVVSVPERRDELRAHLAAKQIGCEVYYPVAFHEQECFRPLGYTQGQFPNSEAAARSTLALPVYPELTREMQDYVIEQITAFYRQ